VRLAILLLALAGCAPPVDEATKSAAWELAAQVDADRVWNDVLSLAQLHRSDVKFECGSLERPPDHWCDLSRDASRAFVERRFRMLGLEPTLDPNDTNPPTTNVFAEVRGTSRPDELITIGAHFDAFYEGADDNSSSVAVMLEVARLVAQAPRARTVRFVGYDLEELGLLGSSRMSRSQAIASKTLVLDCVGYSSTMPGSQKGLPGFPLPDVGDFLAVIGNEQSRASVETSLQVARGAAEIPTVLSVIAAGRGDGPLVGNLMRSDHAPLWLSGHDAVFFTDTANFRNPNYHLETDTPDTLDPAFLAGVARVTTMTISAWSDAR
jgi:Zn-dependent M28 family amino/carboxypeptidase